MMDYNNTGEPGQLEEQYKQKLQEYTSAEAAGLTREQLSELYKELKDLNYQLSTSRPGNYYSNATNQDTFS